LLAVAGACHPGRREASKLIIGKYGGTIYPEDNGHAGAIDLGSE